MLYINPTKEQELSERQLDPALNPLSWFHRRLSNGELSYEEWLGECFSNCPRIIEMTPVTEIPEIKVKRPLYPAATTISELVGDSEIGEAIDVTTDHAWLVVLGLFAQALGLIVKLEEVHLDQRQGSKGPPQMKLIEFLVGILGGIDYLQDLNKAAEPIALDEELAQAWAQDIFCHYSQVSRTPEKADEQTLQEVLEALRTISEPYIQQAVIETLQKQDSLVIDLDLTGRPVSPQSTDYLDADFGWMDDGVRKGYQAAITSLVCERWQRLMLTCERYSGRTSSADCLQAAVTEVENLLGIRPRRRTELLLASRRQMMAVDTELQKSLEKKEAKERILWLKIDQTRQEIKKLYTRVTELEVDYQAKGKIQKRYCQLAKARRKLDSAIKREARLWRNLQKLSRQRLSISGQISQQQERLMQLDQRLADLQTDNCANPNPIKIILRIDAGFSTGKNLTWLIEMGYTILTKAHHSQTSHSLLKKLSPNASWTIVGKNADACYMPDYYQNNCPYPLAAMLTRYHLPEKKRYTTLFYYDETPPPSLPDWFKRYNGRQTIEAGIKETIGVFTLKRHLVRSPIGMCLQEQFAVFGANFVRWAAAWVKDLLSESNRNFERALCEAVGEWGVGGTSALRGVFLLKEVY